MIKNVFLFVTILFANFLIGQKKYAVKNTLWSFKNPVDYVIKTDNFEKERKVGEEYLTREEGIVSSNDDVILLAIEKKDSSANAIVVSYKNNLTIKKYTLKGYANALKDILDNDCKRQYQNEKDECSVVVEELVIDSINFVVVKQTVLFKEDDYVGTKYFYIAEIEDKEFMITVVNTNEVDRKNALNSVLNSTFKVKN